MKQSLATEIISDLYREPYGELESLHILEREIIEIQKKVSELQKLIQAQRIHVSDFLGESEGDVDDDDRISD